MNCLSCNRAMYLDKKPNGVAVRHCGRGLCVTCWARHRQNGTLDDFTPAKSTVKPTTDPDIPQCSECHKPTRPAWVKSAQAPGTVKGNKSGYCENCWPLVRHRVSKKQIEDTRTALEAYLKWRAPYRAKVGA